MDLSGALPDEIILEVYDEEWVQAVDYEYVPFRCCKCHEHGHLIRDFPLKKLEKNMKTNKGKDHEGFTKMGGKGKGGKKYQRKTSKDKHPSHNSFKILEEGGNNAMNQALEDNPVEKEKDASMEDVPENNKLKEDMPSIMELGKDYEMTPSEVGIEDHEL